MFFKIANYGGNTYFEYDFDGKPFQYVEVRSVPKVLNEARWNLTLENDKIYRQTVKRWAECIALDRYFAPKGIKDLCYRGVVPEGYSLHHIHPRALGGYTTELSNMVLIPNDLHNKLHDFMRDFVVAKCLPLTPLTAQIPQGKKIFMSVPVLPPVVTAQDISFALKPVNFEADLNLAKKLIFGYLKRYPNAFSRPLFINGVIAKNPKQRPVVSWPPPRIQPTDIHQVRGTSQQASRFQPERWSFNEWRASVRNKSRNFRT